MVTQNITFNGTSGYTAFGETGSWTDFRINRASIGIDPGVDPAQNNLLNVSMSGPAWNIRALNFYNDDAFDFDVTLTDTAGTGRRIDRMEYSGQGDLSISLIDTRIRYLQVYEADSLALTLGTQRMNSLESDSASNTITMGTGQLSYARLGDYVTATVNVINGGGGGYIGALELADNTTNTITNGGEFGFITSQGNNTFTFTAGGDALSLGSGVSTVNLTGGYYGAITSYSGTNTITVGAAAVVRSIGFSDGLDTITVNGRVEQMQVGANNDVITVGAAGEVNSVLLGDGNNRFTLNGGNAWAVTAFQGNDTATINAGQIDQLYLGSGINTITVGAGAFIGQVRVNEGADRLTLSGGEIQTVILGGGANTATLSSGQIDGLVAYDGNDRVTVTGARVSVINVGDGTNTVITGTNYVQSLVAYDGTDTFTIGAGGAGFVNAGGGNNTITTTSGFVDFIQTFDGRDTINIRSGDALNVSSGGGNDVINAVSGRVDFVDTGSGNDSVAFGAGGGRFVVLGDGDDVVTVAAFNPAWGVVIQGDAGIDTLNLTQMGVALTFSLDESGYQNPGAPGGNVTVPGRGYVSVVGVENLVGGNRSDSLTGNADGNVITGLAGADTIDGQAGIDRLLGGAGNDVLIGGADADDFVFVPTDGSDRIADFLVGQDQIELRAANAIGDLTFTQVGTDVRITYQTLTITVDDQTVAALQNAANFLF